MVIRNSLAPPSAPSLGGGGQERISELRRSPLAVPRFVIDNLGLPRGRGGHVHKHGFSVVDRVVRVTREGRILWADAEDQRQREHRARSEILQYSYEFLDVRGAFRGQLVGIRVTFPLGPDERSWHCDIVHVERDVDS